MKPYSYGAGKPDGDNRRVLENAARSKSKPNFDPLTDERPIEHLSLQESKLLLKALREKAKAQGHWGGLHGSWCDACSNITLVKQHIRRMTFGSVRK